MPSSLNASLCNMVLVSIGAHKTSSVNSLQCSLRKWMQSSLARHLLRPLRKQPLKGISQKTTFLSFVTRANCEPRQTTSRNIYPSAFDSETHWFTQVLTQHRARKDALSGEYPALISFSLCLPEFRRTRFRNSQYSGSYPYCLSQVNYPWRFSAFYDWWKIIFPFGPILWSVGVLLGLPQKHIHGNKVSTLMELTLPKWTSIHQYAKSASELFKLMLSGVVAHWEIK